MSSTAEIASAFIEGAPPGELSDVVGDIKALTKNESTLIPKLEPAFQKYSEEQLTTTNLPGSSQSVLVSKYNRLPDGRYFETESSTSWEFDHVTQVCLTLKLVLDIAKLWQKASSPQSYRLESLHAEFIKSLLKSFSTHASEHYSSPTYGVYPFDDQIAMLLVANRYSPSNFWNGRWRSTYLYNPSSGSLQGTINVNVHYYEDGNVALTTKKPVDISVSGGATEVVRKIAGVERAYQEELNRAFVAMNEQSFKGLRRQLPVTRQKVEWEKVGGYRLGSDLRGGAR